MVFLKKVKNIHSVKQKTSINKPKNKAKIQNSHLNPKSIQPNQRNKFPNSNSRLHHKLKRRDQFGIECIIKQKNTGEWSLIVNKMLSSGLRPQMNTLSNPKFWETADLENKCHFFINWRSNRNRVVVFKVMQVMTLQAPHLIMN